MCFFQRHVIYQSCSRTSKIFQLWKKERMFFSHWYAIMSVWYVCLFTRCIYAHILSISFYCDKPFAQICFSYKPGLLLKRSINTFGLDLLLCLTSFDTHTFWTIAIGGTFGWITIYGTYQSQVQRYCTSPARPSLMPYCESHFRNFIGTLDGRKNL